MCYGSRYAASDELSKFEDDTGWQLNPKYFQWANNSWGRAHAANLLASDRKSLTPYVLLSGTAGVGLDAFNYPWRHCNCWITPPST